MKTKETETLMNEIKKLGFEFQSRVLSDNSPEPLYEYWTLPQENSKLKNTPFYYSEENDFIHFTSLESLFSILNSKHLRLYNLPNMDDKYELEYPLKVLSFPDDVDVNETKEQLYILSMCSSSLILDEEPKKRKHLLWKLHGRDGKGVILRLKIENDLSSWYNYYLTKCFYNLDNFSAIKKLHAITNNELLDIKLATFIKLPIYEFENEIRLVFDKLNSGWWRDKYKNITYPLVYPDKLTKQENISYFQLPLWNFFKNIPEAYPIPPNGLQINYEIPKISITEIILGYRYNDNDLKKIQEKLILFDSNIKVRHSDLKQFY